MSKKTEKITFRELPPNKQLEVANPELTPEQIIKLKKLMEFFDQYGIDYSKFTPEHLSFIQGKRAYPNYDQYMYIPGQHDMNKWLMAVKNIHYKKKAGVSFQEAVRQSTQDWRKMEIYDFLNWLRFHEEGAHMKYKTAQVWYENGQPGYFLHVKPDPTPKPEPLTDGNAVNDAREEAERSEEKRNVIEKQRAKIIGRLDSAEKLLRSPDGQQFAGDELENLMEAIYSLKKKVQLVNKLSVSTRLYEDMIVREANVLIRKGFNKAASVLYSVAQTPGASAEGAIGVSGEGAYSYSDSPADPSGAGQSGMPNGYVNLSVNDPTQPANINEDRPPLDAFTANTPSGSVPVPPVGPPPSQPTAQSTPAIMPQEDPQPKGIKEFIENMNEGNITENDNLEVEDPLEVVEANEDQLIVLEAQVVPPGPPRPGVPPVVLEDLPITDSPAPDRGKPVNAPPPAPEGDDTPLEVTEDDIPVAPDSPSGGPGGSSLDSKIDATFDSVTMEEIVSELEDISKYYKVREMPRRLARVDMMFDSKGISAFFPALAEAQNKALEANNYIATRIDDILSKVRGSMASENMEAKLKQDEEKDKQRKQMRKEQEQAELQEPKKETPAVEMGELGAPVATPAKTPIPRPLG